MKIAIVSDIHGNFNALQKVLEDIEKRNISEVICLGDSIGYGPEPVKCFRKVMEVAKVVLMGNHELAILKGAENFNPIAKQALEWTKKQIEEAGLIEEIKKLKKAYLHGNTLYVHGSVREPTIDYVEEVVSIESYVELIYTIEKDFRNFDVCFVGHNHKPFLATKEGSLYPHSLHNRFNISGEKLYVCVGSVGQPRDNDPRSCYVIYDGEYVEYIRVEYDIEETAKKIISSGLPQYLAYRLLKGI